MLFTEKDASNMSKQDEKYKLCIFSIIVKFRPHLASFC